MKKIITILCILIFIELTFNSCFASDIEDKKSKFGIDDFLTKSNKYTDINIADTFNDIIKGKFDNNKILNILKGLTASEFRNTLKTLSGLIIIILINSLIKAVSENLGNESVSQVANFAQYILIITILMKDFSNVIQEIKISIENLTAFSNTLIPLMLTLIITTGNITTSGVIEPILLFMVSFIGNFVTKILIPLVLIGTSLGIVSKISPNLQIQKLSKFSKKSSVWIITTVLTIFISIATLEGGLTSNIDGITKKTGKSIVSVAVPVVGSILGDALETISGYSNLLKNAVGTIGVFVIVGICIKPIVRIGIYTVFYYLCAALCEPIAEKNVTEIIGQMAETFKILLSVMIMILVMLIIGLAIVMKITS